MKNYHVRVTLLSGTPLDGYACQGLAQAVSCLNRITGKQWPYQVIHRAVKAGNCWGQAYEQPAVTAPEPAEKRHVARCVFVSVEAAGEAPFPELPYFVQPDRPAVELPLLGEAAQQSTQPFKLLLDDAALVAMWVPDIIEKGVSARDAPVFRRLEKKLLHLLKLARYEPLRREL